MTSRTLTKHTAPRPGFFGTALILLLWLLHDGLGRTGTVCAAALTAISPAMVFYSRYFIHEMLLVFFTAFVLAAGWRYSQTRQLRWAILTGAGLGLMSATKETFVLAVAAMGLAAPLTSLLSRWPRLAVPHADCLERQTHFHRIARGGAGFDHFVHLLLQQPERTLDALRTYQGVAASGRRRVAAHSPVVLLFERLAFFHQARPVGLRADSFFGGRGMIAALIGRGLDEARLNWRVSYILHTGVDRDYSAIPYKTPWSMLGFFTA